MVYQMVVQDIMTFACIQAVFLGSFAQAFVVLAGEHGVHHTMAQLKYFFSVMVGEVRCTFKNVAGRVVKGLVWHTGVAGKF